MSPVLFGTGHSARESWFYFTENELSPGAIRWHNCKFVFNLRGDNGAQTGGLAVDTNLGWKGPEKYVATVPQVFDLWQDPQERYDIFMTNWTETDLDGVVMGQELEKIMGSWAPTSSIRRAKMQSMGYDGPIEISKYQKLQSVREMLEKDGIHLSPPTGN